MNRLRWWAELLDSRFRIPGTHIRFGLDPILSLVPGLGDLVSPIFTVLLLTQAVRMSVPKVILVRMVLNALLDAIIGVVPFVGNIGDLFWRANHANLGLLEHHTVPGRRPTRGDYVFVWAAAAVLGLLVAVPVIVGIWIGMQLWSWR